MTTPVTRMKAGAPSKKRENRPQLYLRPMRSSIKGLLFMMIACLWSGISYGQALSRKTCYDYLKANVDTSIKIVSSYAAYWNQFWLSNYFG